MDKRMLEIKDVGKMIGKQTIVEQITLQIDKGHALALCGGNGAGKSTILRMIAGILQPSSGTIRVNGLQWRDDRHKYSAQLGYMPDDYRFGQGLSAEETLTFWAALRKVPRERVLETMEMVGLRAVMRKSVVSFSKGMRQRLLFAQALLSKPALLVLDEPTNGLDPYWIDLFVELVRGVKAQGHTVLFSTHQLEVADAAADRIVFVKDGRIATEGATESFRQLYGTR